MKVEKGNALFLILIAVALFAALSYAVTSSGRGGSGIDKEQASILAAQITQYGASVAVAVQRIKTINGTQDTMFEWQNDVYETLGGVKQFSSGINTNDRDSSDNIFSVDGGDITPLTFDDAGDRTGVGTGALTPGHANLV